MVMMKRVIIAVLSLCFVAVIIYSGYRIWDINADYAHEKRIHEIVLEYKPGEPEYLAEEVIVNQSVIDLQALYPDAVGWLTIPNTKIDYPFVWYTDNEYYLRRDIDGNYAYAGTLFVDCVCEKDLSSQNTIIYGHHMNNESMFGSLNYFNDKAFFDQNQSGTIFLPHDILSLEIFAYMIVEPLDNEIYNTVPGDGFSDYVKQNARHYRDIGLSRSDRIVTLSTCAYEFNNARMVLLARVSGK
jgi:sortase B